MMKKGFFFSFGTTLSNIPGYMSDRKNLKSLFFSLIHSVELKD